MGRLNRLLDRKLDRLRIPYIMLRSALDLFALLIIGGRTCPVFFVPTVIVIDKLRILRGGASRNWLLRFARARTARQQPRGEFASTDPTTRTQDARFQVSGVSPKISLNSRSHLQHFQRPTSSHFCKDALSLSRVGYEHVARGSPGRLKIFGTQNSRVLLSTT